MKIYESLAEVADRFDVFLFDAYGVFWSGKAFYEGCRELMADLVRQGKLVMVMSNSTQLREQGEASYGKKGLQKGVHYTDFITSGQVLREFLCAGGLQFKNNLSPRKVYVLGNPEGRMFEDTVYQKTDNPAEAEFFYISVPQLRDEKDFDKYKNDGILHEAKSGAGRCWDSTSLAPFEATLREMLVKYNLPAVNGNPDLKASEKDISTGELNFVVRQGSLAQAYQAWGGELVEFGKPHAEIYDYAMNLLKNDGKAIDKSRIAMVGDTVRTDIKGAVDFGIVPVLCLETGVTQNEIRQGRSLSELCAAEQIDENSIIKIKHV